MNLRHSVFFFGLVALIVNIPYVRSHAFPLFCLILVSSLGTSHGALDYLKGKQILKGMSKGSMIYFYLLYVGVALGTIICWFLAPSFLMGLFLLLACFHFGKEDSGDGVESFTILDPILFTLKGGVIVTAPLAFHTAETADLLKMLGMTVSDSIEPALMTWALVGCWLATLAVGRHAGRTTKLMVQFDFFAIVLLNVALQPLLAFTIYFCVLHSVRHSLEIVERLDQSLVRGMVKFTRAAWLLTAIVGVVFGVTTAGLMIDYTFSEASARVIFLGLAALTFPHILLEHLYERHSRSHTEVTAVVKDVKDFKVSVAIKSRGV